MIVQNVLPEKGLVLLAGDPKVGKTFLSLELGIALATDGVALGAYSVDPGLVIYVGEDSPPFDVAHQMRMLMADKGLAAPDLNWMKFCLFEGARVDSIEGITALEKALREIEMSDDDGTMRLLILDSFRKLHSRNENDSEEMRLVMSLLRVLAERCCVLLLHHFTKPQEGRTVGPRGSGEIEAGCDAAFYLKRRGDEVEALLARARAIDADSFRYRLDYTRDSARFELVPQKEEGDTEAALLGIVTKAMGMNEILELGTPLFPDVKKDSLKKRFYRELDRLMFKGVMRKRPDRKFEPVGQGTIPYKE
jgi:KaiC/GvpD/RAD55 family RecA-like ATPase